MLTQRQLRVGLSGFSELLSDDGISAPAPRGADERLPRAPGL